LSNCFDCAAGNYTDVTGKSLCSICPKGMKETLFLIVFLAFLFTYTVICSLTQNGGGGCGVFVCTFIEILLTNPTQFLLQNELWNAQNIPFLRLRMLHQLLSGDSIKEIINYVLMLK
jgi:hypothetical protein